MGTHSTHSTGIWTLLQHDTTGVNQLLSTRSQGESWEYVRIGQGINRKQRSWLRSRLPKNGGKSWKRPWVDLNASAVVGVGIWILLMPLEWPKYIRNILEEWCCCRFLSNNYPLLQSSTYCLAPQLGWGWLGLKAMEIDRERGRDFYRILLAVWYPQLTSSHSIITLGGGKKAKWLGL